MSVVIPARAITAVSEAADPKKAIIEIVGDLSGVDIMYNMILVGTYIRPNKTKGGIIRPDVNVQEDTYQGKVGLVLKLGPDCFVDDDYTKFNGQKADVGEWCVYKVGDAWSVTVNGYPCRLMKDSNIKMKVSNPEVIF